MRNTAKAFVCARIDNGPKVTCSLTEGADFRRFTVNFCPADLAAAPGAAAAPVTDEFAFEDDF